MALIFNEYGNLTPNNAIHTSKEEIENIFVSAFPESTTRRILYEILLCYANDLKELLGEEKSNLDIFFLIDGSFVTQKQNPNDIDLVVFIDYELFSSKIKELKNFKCDYSQPKGLLLYPGIHAFMVEKYPETHKKYLIYQADYLQWLFEDFGKDRKGRKKGMLQIALDELL